MSIELSWKTYLFEFLSIFIGVSLAFSLNKWNEDRKSERFEEKILMEIKNGLQLIEHIEEEISKS